MVRSVSPSRPATLATAVRAATVRQCSKGLACGMTGQNSTYGDWRGELRRLRLSEPDIRRWS